MALGEGVRVGDPVTRIGSIGRGAEWAAVRQAVDEALAGRGGVVLITGEPGIGKTLLAEDAARFGQAEGATVVVTRCPSGAGAPAYWPWVEALRVCGQEARIPPGWLDGGDGQGHGDGHGRGSPVPLGRLSDDDPDPDPGTPLRFQQFHQVAAALHEAAQPAPLILVLDDLHGADIPSLRLFEVVASTVHRGPILLVGAYRDVGLAPDHPLVALAGALPSDTVRVELQALDTDAVGQLVTATAPEHDATAGQVEWVQGHTGGNPLFVKEVVRLLAGQGALDMPPEALVTPAGVRGVIRQRLASLPSDVIEILRWAALCGDEFDAALVAQASGVAPHEVQAALAVAGRGRLVQPQPGRPERPGGHGFSHGLVAEALRAGMDPSERQRRHLRLGQILASPSSTRPATMAEISHHLLAALPDGDPVAAVDGAARAAADAAAALAWEEATRLYDRTLRAARDTGADQRRVAELLIERAKVVGRQGDGGAARQAALDAVAAASAAGNADVQGRAALLFSGRTFADAGDPTAIGVLERALAVRPPAVDPLRSVLVARLAEELHYVDRERSGALTDEALAMADQTGDPAARWEALIQKQRRDRGGADLDDRLATSTALVTLAQRLGDGDVERTAHGRIRRIVDALAAGRRAVLDQELEAFARTVDGGRLPSLSWFVPLWRGALALAEGRLEQAEAHAEAAAPLAQARGDYALGQWMTLLASIRLQQRRLHELEGPLAAAAERYPTVPVYRSALAFVHTELDRPASAQSLVEPLAADGFAGVPIDGEWMVTAWCLAETCVAVERPDWGRALSTRMLPYAHHQAVSGSGALFFGPVARALGRLAILAGDDAAEGHFDDAIRAAQAFGAGLWLAQTQLDQAGLLLRRGRPADRRRAGAQLAHVRRLADECGLIRLQHQLDALPAPDGARPASPADTADTAGTADEAVPTGAHVFRRDGDYWTVAYRGRCVRLRDLKGLHDIARLLATPGREIHVFDLLDAPEPPPGGAAPVLDAQGRAALRRRLGDLHEELEEAERFADTARADLVHQEVEAITAHLASSLGLGGRERQLDDPVERARKAVWRRIRTTLDRIDAQHPTLAHHLRRSLRTGTFCSYTPEVAVDWLLT